MSSRPSFQKRQKEQARKEKQRLKAERKQQRKQEQDVPQAEASEAVAAVPGQEQSSLEICYPVASGWPKQ